MTLFSILLNQQMQENFSTQQLSFLAFSEEFVARSKT